MAYSLITEYRGDAEKQNLLYHFDENISKNKYRSNPENYPEMLRDRGFAVESLNISKEHFPNDVEKIITAFEKDPYKWMFQEYKEDGSLKRTEMQLVTFSKQGSLLAGKLALLLAKKTFLCRSIKINRLVDIIFEGNKWRKENELNFGEGIHDVYELADYLFIDNFEQFSSLTAAKKMAVEEFINKRLSLGLVNHLNFRYGVDKYVEDTEAFDVWNVVFLSRFTKREFNLDEKLYEQGDIFE